MSYTYPFPAHYVTTDIVTFTFRHDRLYVLLIRRGNEPFRGKWALPGGFLRPKEDLDACARRELAEETSLQQFFLEQFTAVGTLGRDPRGRVITVAYLALVRWEPDVKGGTDAEKAGWFALDDLPDLAFDHDGLIRKARARLEQMLQNSSMLFLKFLPEEFTVEQMQAVHDAVLGQTARQRDLHRRQG